MITAKLQGRRLVLAVETEPDEPAITPFLVSPMSAKAGRELSTRYLFTTEGLPIEDGSLEDDLIEAFGRDNYVRADNELSQAEGELLTQAAYFWQSVGGLDAVRALLEVDANGVQGGEDGRGKALAVFRLRMVPLLSQIRHRLESARRTLADATPVTSSPDGGEQPVSGHDSKPSSEPLVPSTSQSSSSRPSPATTD